MKMLLIALTISLASSCALAQQSITRLQCEGNYTNYQNNIHDLKIKGGFIEIQKDNVKVVEILGFASPEGTKYLVSSTNEARVCFKFDANSQYFGCLNRFSGELQLSQMSEDRNKIVQLYNGNCYPIKSLF